MTNPLYDLNVGTTPVEEGAPHERPHKPLLLLVAIPENRQKMREALVFRYFPHHAAVLLEAFTKPAIPCPSAKVADDEFEYFRSQGYFIGSGVIEAGCKTVIGRRLKQSGMFS